MATTRERFWALVDRSQGPAGHWLWLGRRTRRGVPVFEVRGRRTTARRYAYRCEYGDPGPKVVVAGICELAGCVNWAHARPSSRRTVAVTNGSAATRNAARTHCRCGLALAGDNLYRHPGSGRRACRACRGKQKGRPAVGGRNRAAPREAAPGEPLRSRGTAA